MPGLFSREAHRRRLAAQVIAVLLLHGQQGFLETAGVFGATDPVQFADDLRPVTQRRIPRREARSVPSFAPSFALLLRRVACKNAIDDVLLETYELPPLPGDIVRATFCASF